MLKLFQLIVCFTLFTACNQQSKSIQSNEEGIHEKDANRAFGRGDLENHDKFPGNTWYLLNTYGSVLEGVDMMEQVDGT